jgi:hypothetical protein
VCPGGSVVRREGGLVGGCSVWFHAHLPTVVCHLVLGIGVGLPACVLVLCPYPCLYLYQLVYT